MFTNEIKSKGEHQDSLLRFLAGVFRVDITLLILLLILAMVSLVILYSASGKNMDMVLRQVIRLSIGFAVMLMLAQVSMHNLRLWTPWLYALGLLALLLTFFMGVEGKGAQRWLDLGFFRFQPSEMMKPLVPMTVAWFVSGRGLPPKLLHLLVAAVLVGVPMVLIAKQPDLGTALLVGFAGFAALFLAGIRWWVLLILGGIGVCAATPLAWSMLREYQKERILTFLNPERDPLGSGYHIIQSKIAIGSGGVYGKGWLNGTQSHLDFLPERTTDFIFSVFGEEFGLFGGILLLLLYFFVVFRGINIAMKGRDNFSRIIAGSISLTFAVYILVNVGMVTGLLPVVGVPLPLISYGGTSMVTLMAGFGILMSIRSDRRLLSG